MFVCDMCFCAGRSSSILLVTLLVLVFGFGIGLLIGYLCFGRKKTGNICEMNPLKIFLGYAVGTKNSLPVLPDSLIQIPLLLTNRLLPLVTPMLSWTSKRQNWNKLSLTRFVTTNHCRVLSINSVHLLDILAGFH